MAVCQFGVDLSAFAKLQDDPHFVRLQGALGEKNRGQSAIMFDDKAFQKEVEHDCGSILAMLALSLNIDFFKTEVSS